MSFTIDKQTTDDLNLAGKFKQGSVFGLFNKVHTRGGERLLEGMFQRPLTDAVMINERSSLFALFQQLKLDFPLERKQFEEAENYFNSDVDNNQVIGTAGNLVKKIQAQVLKDEQYHIMRSGFTAAINILKKCKQFFGQLNSSDNAFCKQISQVNALFSNKQLNWLSDGTQTNSVSFFKWSNYDHLLRVTLKKELQHLLKIIYELDVYMAVGKCAAENGYGYAKALPAERFVFKAEDMKHPLLKNAVGNKISMDRTSNMVFLTGANMAGKSTLMKTIGISFFLAHLGFPVAAKNMEFSVKEGLASSINTPDNLSMGYSHYYAEVMRVKNVALEVADGKNMLVIFDELFKGTNVKDAYDATYAVTRSFSEYENCFFIISTHIIEVGEALKAECNNIQFKYLPTILEGAFPRYTYTLSEGISCDRQGMMIIENEGIPGLLEATKSH